MKAFAKAIGSLWFAAVLLVLLLVAMACATIFEVRHGTERALLEFYHAWWFEFLLYLIGVNVLISMLLRWPFSRRQVGFVTTHGGILLILIGAWITQQMGIDGRIGVLEGQSVTYFTIPIQTLNVMDLQSQARWAVELDSRAIGGFADAEFRNPQQIDLGKLGVTVEQYLPDSRWQQQVLNDNPEPSPAIEVELSIPGHRHREWIFAGTPATIDQKKITYRALSDAEALRRILEGPQAESSPHMLKLIFGEEVFDIPMSECQDEPVAIGETGYSVRVLRYLPHANVGAENALRNLSQRPVNPAIEAELSGPSGTEKRIAFARFPDFESMHLKKKLEALKLTFVAAQEQTPAADVDIIAGPQGELFVSFGGKEHSAHQPLTMAQPAVAPAGDLEVQLLRSYARARRDWTAELIEPVRKKGRQPAIRVQLSSADHSAELWLQKFTSRKVSINGTPHELMYGDKQIDLGFDLKLDDFNIGYYPGGRRPRSFESHVTISDSRSGAAHAGTISMNHPMTYAGYDFFQSSYRMGQGQTASFLSVSKDPGKPVVFAGYIATMVGMVIVMGIRMADKRRARHAAAGTVQMGSAQPGTTKNNRQSKQPGKISP